MSSRRHHNLPTADEAEMVLELWATKRFDTLDIARFSRLHESVVDRLIHAARDMTRLLYAEAQR
jgi:hypothetical protein